MKAKAGKKSLVKESISRKGGSEAGALKGQSRLQKKQMKRVRFLTKLEGGGQSLSARKTEFKKKGKRTGEKKALKIASLASLADSLPCYGNNPVTTLARKGKKPQGRSSQHVVLNETKQLAAVLSHPEFQANPFLAIHRHLSNTVLAEQVSGKEAFSKGTTKSKSQNKTSLARQMEE